MEKNSNIDADIFLVPEDGENRFHSTAPVFLIHEPDRPYNRIGTPRAETDNSGNPHISVDPTQGTLFFADYQFSTKVGVYTNLLYRIHFERVPFGFGNLHLTAGKNPGLFIILTLDRNKEILLVTTVHTCGCYLAFFPTNNLPPASFPENWPAVSQRVYGKKLPASIRAPTGNEKIVITLESGSHRVIAIATEQTETLSKNNSGNFLEIRPLEDLRLLPYRDGKTSFFETRGLHRGYVKNNTKPLERMLMSWWTLDWHIGQDKMLGNHDVTGTRFYTSLKFWRRDESDMWNFAGFLQYWGWKL